MTNFYYLSYKEICDKGFNLNRLQTIKTVLSESHIEALKQQIAQLQSIELKIDQSLPSVRVLQDFLSLLIYLKTLRVTNLELIKTGLRSIDINKDTV